MSQGLSDVLGELESCFSNLSRGKLVEALRPGVLPEITGDTLVAHGLPVRDDLAALYAWHDGTRVGEDLTLDDIWIFPCFIFRPLAVMVDIYGRLCRSGYWSEDWFPVFMDDAGYFYVIDNGAEVNGAVRCIRNDFIDQPIIEYDCIESMIRTLVAAYRRGIYYLDNEGVVSEDPHAFNRLAAELNPDIPWWTDPEFA